MSGSGDLGHRTCCDDSLRGPTYEVYARVIVMAVSLEAAAARCYDERGGGLEARPGND